MHPYLTCNFARLLSDSLYCQPIQNLWGVYVLFKKKQVKMFIFTCMFFSLCSNFCDQNGSLYATTTLPSYLWLLCLNVNKLHICIKSFRPSSDQGVSPRVSFRANKVLILPFRAVRTSVGVVWQEMRIEGPFYVRPPCDHPFPAI